MGEGVRPPGYHPNHFAEHGVMKIKELKMKVITAFPILGELIRPQLLQFSMLLSFGEGLTLSKREYCLERHTRDPNLIYHLSLKQLVNKA